MNAKRVKSEKGFLQKVNQYSDNNNIGYVTVRRLAVECGALIKIGKSTFVDAPKLDEYIKTFTE